MEPLSVTITSSCGEYFVDAKTGRVISCFRYEGLGQQTFCDGPLAPYNEPNRIVKVDLKSYAKAFGALQSHIDILDVGLWVVDGDGKLDFWEPEYDYLRDIHEDLSQDPWRNEDYFQRLGNYLEPITMGSK